MSISAMKQALEAFVLLDACWYQTANTNPRVVERKTRCLMRGAVFALRTAIEEAEKSEWVGLTDEEVGGLTVFDGLTHVEVPILADFVRAIEAKLKEKNT